MAGVALDGTIIFSGVIFGLSGGLSPGPLLTLVISETLRHGVMAGIRISMAPLITDAPIVLATLYVLSRLTDILPILGAISIAGALFLLYLGFMSIRFKGAEAEKASDDPKAMRKGVIANFLNPSPYLFWLSIGSPLIIEAADTGVVSAIGFLVVFYVLLVGSKMGVAVLTARSRRFLKSGHYVYAIRFLGIVLMGFAGMFFKTGLSHFGIWKGF